jgi:predicted dienelactone hydrolase
VRALEIVLLVSTLVGAAWVLRTRQASSTGSLALLAALAMIGTAQAVIEGSRWQLFPAYLACALLITSVGLAVFSARDEPWARRTVAVVAVVLAGLAGLASWALPVDLLPDPPGSEAIGTVTALLTDAERAERYGPEPGTAREIVVQAWYPADPAAEVDPEPWIADVDAFGAQAAREVGLPRFALGHLEQVQTSSTPGARAASTPTGFPVVVLSHGWSGFRTIHSDLAESLASRGYVVLAIDHTFGALATLRPDGEVVGLDQTALPDASTVSAGDYQEAGRALVATFAADIRRTLDALAADELPALAGAVDLDRVAFVGHSTGGGGAMLACSRDPRCDAVVGFDPWVVPVPDTLIEDGLAAPMLSLRSEEWTRLPNDGRLAALHAASSGPEGRVALLGTEHRDFTMIPTLSPLSGVLGLRGPLPTARTREIMDTWTARFLDHHLRGQGTDPLVDPPAFTETTIDGTTEATTGEETT